MQGRRSLRRLTQQEMNTVLKKAGIAVVAATACLLAASPLAFADDDRGDTNIGNITNNNVQANPQTANCTVVTEVTGPALSKVNNEPRCTQDNSVRNHAHG
jgi:hypothetical protein